jgi:NADH dehydrogenase
MRVAVLGAGYAGLAVARALEESLPADVDLVVVEERDTHLVQHLLHRVVRQPSLADEIQVPLADVLDRATHRRATVEGIDPDAGRADLSDGELEFDVGAVCLGARTDFHDIPGVAEHGTPLKRVAHAETIRARARGLAEAGGGRIVVGGAGLSGVQVAGELAALVDDAGATDAVTVHLVEQADRIAPTFRGQFGRAIDAELHERGVLVETDRAVVTADADRLTLSDGSERPYDQFVWTGGITAPAAVGRERPTVRSRLRLGRRTVGLGDAVRVVDADGTAVPDSAQTALAQADVAATNVERLVDHRRSGAAGFEPRLETYRSDTAGWVVTVGDGAVATVGPTVLRGGAAKAAKAGIGARYFRRIGTGPKLRSRLRDRL